MTKRPIPRPFYIGGRDLNETRHLLDKYKVRLKKGLGQNFLIDETVVDRIVEGSGISKDDIAIEIGPGAGSMTRVLAENAGQVLAIEIDGKLLPILHEIVGDYENVTIINEDALKVNIIDILPEVHNTVKVVANLPYYITTPLIMKLLEEQEIVKSMTFMVQKEVADRMCAIPGIKAYGALTLAVNYYSAPQKLFDVPPTSFFPRPEVTSTVIRLDRHEKPPVNVKSKEMLFKVIKASFAQRRKTLHNGLCNAGGFGFGRQQMADLLISCEIDPGCRGETLSLQQFAKIADCIENKSEK